MSTTNALPPTSPSARGYGEEQAVGSMTWVGFGLAVPSPDHLVSLFEID